MNIKTHFQTATALAVACSALLCPGCACIERHLDAHAQTYRDYTWVLYDTLNRDYYSETAGWWDLEHAQRMTRGEAWATLVKIRQGGTTEYCDTGPANYPIVLKYVARP